MGNKTALMLLVFTDGFYRFQSVKELCSLEYEIKLWLNN